jgi:delta 1-pyrroline-5-carboxylate dehydrogenase
MNDISLTNSLCRTILYPLPASLRTEKTQQLHLVITTTNISRERNKVVEDLKTATAASQYSIAYSHNSMTLIIDNYIGGKFVPPSTGQYLPVQDPSTGHAIAHVAISGASDVDLAVATAKAAFVTWGSSHTTTMKTRAAIMLQFHALVREHAQELAALIVQENGKNITEALADVAKGNETVEWACSLPQLAQGKILHVSSGGVTCMDRRDPVGVVASIVPFNFPFMVPMVRPPSPVCVCGPTFMVSWVALSVLLYVLCCFRLPYVFMYVPHT